MTNLLAVVVSKVAQYIEKTLFYHARSVRRHKSSVLLLCVDKPLAHQYFYAMQN